MRLVLVLAYIYLFKVRYRVEICTTMTLYNSIGKGYDTTRQSDPRIVATIVELLNLAPGKTIADIGAGTGNYSNAIAAKGYKIVAIEPSAVMQAQALSHPDVRWLTASAENITLPNNSVDAAIVVLAMHHFSNLDMAIAEINRIVDGGNIVIFAFEQDKISDFWLTDYFPYFIQDTSQTFPATKIIAEKLVEITGRNVEVIPFFLPRDLSDMFAAAGWCKPEIYLHKNVRNGISSFAKMSPEELKTGIDRLAADIDNGSWYKKYGAILDLKSYDAGYRIIIAS